MNYLIASVFLCFYALGLSAEQQSKCKEILEGESYTIKLNSPKQDNDQLTWKCNDTPVYRRRNKKIDQTFTVDDDGSLILKDIYKSNACTYKAEHYDKDGKSLKAVTETLCVLSKAPKPKLALDCSKKGELILQCETGTIPQDLKLSWFINKEKSGETKNTLKLSKQGGKNVYKCRLGNKLNEQDSNEVTASCEGSGPLSDGLLFGYNKWMMIGIIAGGGFLLLVLIMSLIVICCKNNRRRKRRRQDEEELRLANLQYIGTTPRPKQTARGQPVPPIPEEQGYYQGPEGEPEPSPVAPQARKQPRPRAPPPPMEDDDEAAIPPLPQPRKKGHRRPDN